VHVVAGLRQYASCIGRSLFKCVEDLCCDASFFGLQDEDVDWQMDTYAACNFQWFLKSGNLVLDYGQVGDAVETGIMHVRGVHERMIDYVHKSYEFDLTAAVV